MRSVFAITIAVIMLLCLGGTVQAAYYSETDLAALPGGSSSYATGINDSGQIAGYMLNSSGYNTACLWQNGTVKDLAIHSGNQSENSYAYGINAGGQVVGYDTWYNSWNSNGSVGVVWDNNSYSFIGLGVAHGINDSGEAIGAGCVWQNGHATALSFDSFCGGVDPCAINNNGQVVGYERNQWSNNWAYLRQNDGTFTTMGYGEGYGINDNGEVVGACYSEGDATQYACFWQNRVLTNLGLQGAAVAINCRGEIVGDYLNSGAWSVFVWDNGTITDLGSGTARGINNNGQIVGYRTNADGTTQAVLWNPVPEPSSLLALFTGLGGLGGLIWRRRR